MKKMFSFDLSNLRGDFFGGLTAGIVALPLALAFGAQTPMGAMAGLYGAIAIAIIAAIFGGTSTQVSGPTAPMTVVSAAVIASSITESGAETVAEALPLVLATFFLAGVIEVLFGIFQLGRYIRYIPYPVVSGFMSGIGVIIIITQIFPILGYQSTDDQALVEGQLPHAEEVILKKIIQEEEAEGVLSGYMMAVDLEETVRRAQQVTPEEIRAEAKRQVAQIAGGTKGTIRYLLRPFQIAGGIDWLNFAVALATMLIIYGFKRITTLIPSSLVALIIMTLVVYFAFPGQVPVIGDAQTGLPPLQLDFFGAFANIGALGMIIKFGFTLAALGAIDSLLTSVVADNLTKTRHDSNRELIGQGLGNMGAALLAGLPGAGATMRTVLNINAGGKTRISGVLSGLFLLAVLLGLGPIVAYIPDAVLAGILFTVGIGIIDYKSFRHFRSVDRADIIIMLVVLVLTVFVDLLVAVAVGMIMASLLFMRRMSDVVDFETKTTPLKGFSQEISWADETEIVDRVGDKVYIKHLNGPLFFGFVSRFREMIKALPTIKVVVIRMDRVPYADQSGLYAMEDAIHDLQALGIKVLFTGLHGQPKDLFESIRLVPGLVPEELSFEDFSEAVPWLEEYLHAEHQISTINKKNT